jgi:hypothetical protein
MTSEWYQGPEGSSFKALGREGGGALKITKKSPSRFAGKYLDCFKP